MDKENLMKDFRRANKIEYPELNGYLDSQIYEYMIGCGGLFLTTKILRKMNIKKGDIVLDIGCGFGTTSIFLAKNFDITVIAVDFLNNVTRPECYEEVIIQSNSVPIVLSIWKSRQTDPCIVFFPGTMIHPLIYEDFLNLLCLNGFNVIGVHLISHGKSPRIKELYSFSDMLQNGKDAITYAINTFNDKVFIMGSSQGGILAIALAGLDNRIKAAYPHNILLPKLPESIYITKFPKWLKHLNKLVVGIIKLGKILTPNLQVGASFYLDLDRITSNKELEKRLHSDPICLTKYPIYFLSSLF